MCCGLGIVLSVRLPDPDDHFGIIKLFFVILYKIVGVLYCMLLSHKSLLLIMLLTELSVNFFYCASDVYFNSIVLRMTGLLL
jgi:hypothetical protein